MKNKSSDKSFQGETFLLKTVSEDGYSVIIGGICPKGKRQEAIQAYSLINKARLGQSKDEFLIDYVLAEAITKISPKWVKLVGASIHVENIGERTGGIIGDPFAEYESATGNIEEISTGLFLISLPGGPGIAFVGTYDDAIVLEKIIRESNMTQDMRIKSVLRKLNEISGIYILVADGSGKESFGGIYISDNNGKEYKGFK